MQDGRAFDTDATFQTSQLAYQLNRLLPRDIAVDHLKEVPGELHARFSALSRTYHYFIHTRKDPFVDQFSCLLRYKLDFPLMNEAGRILASYDDFGAFCKLTPT